MKSVTHPLDEYTHFPKHTHSRYNNRSVQATFLESE